MEPGAYARISHQLPLQPWVNPHISPLSSLNRETATVSIEPLAVNLHTSQSMQGITH